MILDPDKSARLAEFFRRLGAALPAKSRDEALELLSVLLNEVEDELTTIPYQPEAWESDGRMYPPQEDSARRVDGYPRVVRYRNRGHNTFISENGAIEIQEIQSGQRLFGKPGSDGKGVWD